MTWWWGDGQHKVAIPNPGSTEAMEQGCTCPVMDNAYGRGYMGGVKDEQGRTLFVYSEGCPLHGKRGE